ncbi:hypothetical protein MUN82_10300 [Hymenobacter aerilatus]|uniref:Uncharacterized protein n=1 Tax=Hymenobacter aerilatus TaxID=2932251 RepID=A0A8T9SZE4_9BACT|nr:hypothetical protein [Hymenobacter aerilatus]UOR07468.1 hypothetical protein MUN82_10300 [Hymenobacter aerilatus]
MDVEKLCEQYNYLILTVIFSDEEYKRLKHLHHIVTEYAASWKSKANTDLQPFTFGAIYNLETLGIAFEHYDTLTGDRQINLEGLAVALLLNPGFIFSRGNYEFMRHGDTLKLKERLKKLYDAASREV